MAIGLVLEGAIVQAFPPGCEAKARASTKQEAKSAELTADKSEKSDKSEKPAKSEKPEKSEKSEKAEKSKEKKEKKARAKEEAQEPTAEEKEFLEYQTQLADALKKTKTPFSTASVEEETGTADLTSPLTLPPNGRHVSRLSEKLFVPRLYLPGRLQIGKPAQFTIRGKAGYMVALAYADRDNGAKPIYGHKLRLGADRKVVALGKIPEGGVIALKFFAPIEGDLIGQNLFFEAALWPEGHLEQMELAQTVSSESQVAQANSILVLGESEKKKGVRIVPEGAMPIYARERVGGATLDSGKP